MSIAVVQGGGGSIGSQFARQLLKRTSLNVVATSRNPDATRDAILSAGGLDEKRLTVLKLDVTEERTIEDAAKEVKHRFGDASLRLLLNVSGVVSVSDMSARTSADHRSGYNSCTPTSRSSRSRWTNCCTLSRSVSLCHALALPSVAHHASLSPQLNTFGHLLTYKHFVPLLPKTADIRKAKEAGKEDLADGAVKNGLSVLASLTARVGSMGDNGKGG